MRLTNDMAGSVNVVESDRGERDERNPCTMTQQRPD